MKSIIEIFPRASRDTIAANPHLDASKPKKNDSMGVRGAAIGNRRSRMNKVEQEFALILESKRQRGEILRAEFQGITLRWFDMRYTPDFVVFQLMYETDHEAPIQVIRLIEVKGAHIHYRQQALARFKGARGFWPEFTFELHQKTKEGWKQIL